MSMYVRDKPGLLRRLRAAVDVFNRGYPRLRGKKDADAGAMFKASQPLLWPKENGKPQWHLIDFQTYVEEGVNRNALIYSALRYKWNATTAAPLRAYIGDPSNPETLPPEHPLNQLILKPNPWQDWRTLQGQADAFLNISGNAYFWCQENPDDLEGLPSAIYCPRPDRIFIVPEVGKEMGMAGILGYLYVPENKQIKDGIPILPQQMMHVKLFNPLDPLDGLGEGLSPLSSAAYSIDVDNAVTKFLKLFFERGGVPPYFFTFDMPISDETISELQERIQAMYGGGENWMKPGVLGAGGDVKRVGLTFQEMGFEQLDERNESRILGPLGVPPILVGTRFGLKRATYANYKEARGAFWEDVMRPELELFGVIYRKKLHTPDGAFVAHDYTRVPALQKDLPELVSAAFSMWQMGTPADIAYATVGLQVDSYEGSDTSFVPLNMMPAGEEPASPFGPPSQPVDEDDEDEGETESDEEDENGTLAFKDWVQWGLTTGEIAKEFQDSNGLSARSKERIGIQYQTIAKSWDRVYRQKIGDLFIGDYKRLATATEESGDNLDELSMAWKRELTQSEGRWAKAFGPLTQGIVEDQVAMYSGALGMAVDTAALFSKQAQPELAISWFDDYVMRFAADVSAQSYEELSGTLALAQAEGWSIPEIQTSLKVTFDGWVTGGRPSEDLAWAYERMPSYRRQLIARTETIRSSAAAANKLFGQWGVESKEWWTTRDDRTCPWCRSIHGTIIPIDGTYFEEGQSLSVSISGKPSVLKFNYGAINFPPLHVQCRCALLPYKSSWN